MIISVTFPNTTKGKSSFSSSLFFTFPLTVSSALHFLFGAPGWHSGSHPAVAQTPGAGSAASSPAYKTHTTCTHILIGRLRRLFWNVFIFNPQFYWTTGSRIRIVYKKYSTIIQICQCVCVCQSPVAGPSSGCVPAAGPGGLLSAACVSGSFVCSTLCAVGSTLHAVFLE